MDDQKTEAPPGHDIEWTEEALRAYNLGFDEGWHEGRATGYSDGHDRGMLEFLERLETFVGTAQLSRRDQEKGGPDGS